MKPLANLINRIENKNKNKFYKKSESMTTEEAVTRLAKLIIKDLIRHSNLKWNYSLELEVASSTNYEEDDETLIEYIQKQYKDKKLKHWAYKNRNNLETNKKLAILLQIVLTDKKCKVTRYEREFDRYENYKKPKDYQYSIKISL